MNFANILGLLEKYLGLVIVGVTAAQTVPGATNANKKAVTLETIAAVAGAVGTASTNPEVAAVGVIIDIAATIINSLTTKTAAAVVAPAA
jgi:hypothetical protein